MRHLFAPIVASLLYVVPSVASAAVEPTTARASHVQTTHVVAQSTEVAKPADAQAVRAENIADDKAKYAARETKSDKAQDYRGGDTLVIGASAATAILAVILLIVLI
jgi:hypothetical protein